MGIIEKLPRTLCFDRAKVIRIAMGFGMTILLMSCGGKAKVKGLDSEAWKTDRWGCDGMRAEAGKQFPDWKGQLLGLSADDVQEVLGTPEQQELHKRNQKYYFYFYTPGSQCREENGLPGKRIFIRFSALNTVTEVNYKYDN